MMNTLVIDPTQKRNIKFLTSAPNSADPAFASPCTKCYCGRRKSHNFRRYGQHLWAVEVVQWVRQPAAESQVPAHALTLRRPAVQDECRRRGHLLRSGQGHWAEREQTTNAAWRVRTRSCTTLAPWAHPSRLTTQLLCTDTQYTLTYDLSFPYPDRTVHITRTQSVLSETHFPSP